MTSNMKPTFYIAAAALLLAMPACVSKKKYLLAESGRLAALEREADLKERLIASEDENASLSSRLSALLRDTADLGRQIRNYQTMLSTNLSEQDKLNALLQEKMQELDERAQTISQLQDMINEQREQVQSILASVRDAEENGKIYVALSDKLLFRSGSAQVDKRGKEALAKLAEVLNKQSAVDVSIEGHTDTKPIHTARFEDNWDLSVIRATSVVRILTKEYGVNPLQIVPSGRGEFLPVADNDTEEGRSKNRRTEIIIAPKLDKLYHIIDN